MMILLMRCDIRVMDWGDASVADIAAILMMPLVLGRRCHQHVHKNSNGSGQMTLVGRRFFHRF